MVRFTTILALGAVVAFFAFGGLTIIKRAADKGRELKTSLDAKLQGSS